MTVLATRFRESLICIVMTFTPFAKIFAMVWCCKYGISLGIALSLAVSCYGSIGLWIFFMSVFPYVIALTLLTIIQVKMLDEKAKGYAFLMAVTLGEVLIESFM